MRKNRRQKVVVLTGPTASGKTGLAVKLAQEFDGEIISADSRQIYRGLDIGTGKDIPKGQEFVDQTDKFEDISGVKIGYYFFSGIPVWLYDMIQPGQNFSAAEYAKVAGRLITQVHNRDKMPIVVGGSGFYLQALFFPPKTMGIPYNQNLRDELYKLQVPKLQQRLVQADKKRYQEMNNSDSNNPRRLVRAIEVAESGATVDQNGFPEKPDQQVLWLSLSVPFNQLKEAIAARVKARAGKAFSAEVKELIKYDLGEADLVWSAMGYKEWKQYLEGDITKAAAIENWQQREIQYAKRQLTWFKKQERLIFLDKNDKDCYAKTGLLISQFLEKNNEEKRA